MGIGASNAILAGVLTFKLRCGVGIAMLYAEIMLIEGTQVEIMYAEPVAVRAARFFIQQKSGHC